jgi:cell division protein FtsL
MSTQAMSMTGVVAGRAQRDRAESFREHNREVFESQRRARRGPTPEVFFTKHLDNSRIVKADDPERRREMRSFAAVAGVLFLFVMVYVWQHFVSIEMGYTIEAKKLQVEHVREDNRQMRLSEAQLSDPDRIDRIAKQLGLDVPQPGQVVRQDGLNPNAPVMAQAGVPASLLTQ